MDGQTSSFHLANAPDSSSSDGATHVPRPPNSFFCFMQECAAEIREKAAPGSGQQGFVKTAGEQWGVMTPAEKQPFVEKAKRLNAEHKAMNPKYEYFSAESKTKKKARQTAKRQEKQRMVETQRWAAEKRVCLKQISVVSSKRKRVIGVHRSLSQTSSSHATPSTFQSSSLSSASLDFLCPMADASRSRTTSITPPGPAPPSPICHQTINPAIAQMPFHAEALYSTVSGASSSGPPQIYPSQQSLDAQIYPVHHSNQQACHHPAQQQLYPHQFHQYDAQQQCAQPAAMGYDFHKYGNEAQDNNLYVSPTNLVAESNVPYSNTKAADFAQEPRPVDFASADQHSGFHDGAVSQASFLESNGIPIPDLFGGFAFSGSYNDSAAFPVPTDDAALFGGASGFVQTDMASHNDVPYYGAHTAYGFTTESSAPPSFQQTHSEAHLMQLRPHTTHSAQVGISHETQPIVPLDATVASQDTSIAPPTASFVSPELASVPLRRCHRPQQRQEGAPETVSHIPSANGPSSRNLATEERAAPPRGYLRAPHEYTEQDRLSDNASSPNELNPPSHAHSVPQATASSHRRTVSATSCWPATRNTREHRRFCSDTPITQSSVQRTGDWLTDWQASAQLNPFVHAPADYSTPLAAMQTLSYSQARDASYPAPGMYMDTPTNFYSQPPADSFVNASDTAYMSAPDIAYTSAPTSSYTDIEANAYTQASTTSYADAQARSYVDPLTTSSSQAPLPAFPSAPATSSIQAPTTSYEQGSSFAYPSAPTQPYPSVQTQPYPSAPTQPYPGDGAQMHPPAHAHPYEQIDALELPFPDAPVQPHPDLTLPYYHPVNPQNGNVIEHC